MFEKHFQKNIIEKTLSKTPNTVIKPLDHNQFNKKNNAGQVETENVIIARFW